MRKIRLTETELVNVIKKVISEQPVPAEKSLTSQEKDQKYGQSRGPGVNLGIRQLMNPITLDSSLFANGVSKINTQSNPYIEALNRISTIKEKLRGSKLTVYVTGGASAVGTKKGFDNKKLADDRAKNFIIAIKKVHPNVDFVMKKGVVGTATEKNSPQANAEQFVKLNFVEPGMKFPITGPAVDNTQQVLKYKLNDFVKNLPVIDPEEKERRRKTQKYITMCMDIPPDLAQEVQKFIDKIGGRLRSGGGLITPRPGQDPGIPTNTGQVRKIPT